MDELPPKAAALLAAARRAHEPTSADGARVRAAVQASLALPLSQDLTPQSGAPGLSASMAPKALVPLLGKLVVLLSALGGALLWIGAPTQRSTPGASARSQVSPTANAPAAESETHTPVSDATEPPRATVTSALANQRASETSAAVPAPTVGVAKRAVAAPAQAPTETNAQREPSQRQHARHAALVVQPSATSRTALDTPRAETATPLSEQRASAEHDTQPDRARSKPSAGPQSDHTAAREPHAAVPTSAHEELALMRAALGHLNAGDAAGALQLLDRHATQYESGVMAQERVGLRAIALCAAGQVAAGSREQQRFLAMASRSPLAPRVRAACQGEP